MLLTLTTSAALKGSSCSSRYVQMPFSAPTVRAHIAAGL